MNYTIRPAKSEDLSQILTIVNHAIEHSTAIYDYEPRTLQMQQSWFADKALKNFPVLVADFGSEIVGFGTYGTFREKAAFNPTIEHSVYVKDGFQQQGIGKMLLTELISIATAQNYHVMIGCIDADNSSSIKFHQGFGFVSCGTIREVGFKFGRWLDMTLMQLNLKEPKSPIKP